MCARFYVGLWVKYQDLSCRDLTPNPVRQVPRVIGANASRNRGRNRELCFLAYRARNALSDQLAWCASEIRRQGHLPVGRQGSFTDGSSCQGCHGATPTLSGANAERG